MMCGCSSVVERHVANVNVVGSNPITRSLFPRYHQASMDRAWKDDVPAAVMSRLANGHQGCKEQRRRRVGQRDVRR